MIVFHDPSEVPEGFGPAVVVIGKFDGVHTGHRAVIDRARVDAASGDARVVAVTFDRHPLSVLKPEICPQSVVGARQKIRLLEETGIDATLMLHFDEALASLSPRDFVKEVLVDHLHTRTVLVGSDFRFGQGGAGTPESLREMGEEFGFRVDIVDDVRAIDAGRRVSATWIRDALAAGDVETAAKLLGRYPSVLGEVVHGFKRGRELGYPTANLSHDAEGFIPADGVYAGWLVDEPTDSRLRSGIRYPAAISVGTNPTFDDVLVRQVEAYVLDEQDLDLYDHTVEIRFVHRVRGQVAFAGIEPLRAQMADDVRRVREVLR